MSTKMKFLGAILLVIAGTVNANDGRIYFPDEVESMKTPNTETPLTPMSSAQEPSSILATIEKLLPPFWREYANKIISSGVLKFTLDMDRALSESSAAEAELTKNVVFSPMSLAGTMATVLLASGGRTFDEIAQILGLQPGINMSQNSEIVHAIFGMLIEQLNKQKAPGEPVLNFSNGIFVQDGFPIRPEFRQMSEEIYKSEVMNLDFERRSSEAQYAVNSWVNNKTNGMIKEILEGPPSSMTKVILASALYFRGSWDQYFFEQATERSKFFIEPEQSVDVDMMYNGAEFPFYEDKELGTKIVGLPYIGLETTMYLILPKMEGAKNLEEFKKSLTSETIENLIEKMQLDNCKVFLPKMNLSSTLSLRDTLSSLGLHSLFQQGEADLSLLTPGRQESNQMKQNANQKPVDVKTQTYPTYGLDDLRNSHTLVNPGLYVDEMVHKVEIKINEKGTEAAAATVGFLDRMGSPKFFEANRPFLFFIRHDPTKLILFWGTVNQPESHY